MKKLISMMAVLFLVIAIILAGCGKADQTSSNSEDVSRKTADTTSSGKGASTLNAKDGAGKLLEIANQLKTELVGANGQKIKELGTQLEDTWSSFEDKVRPDYPLEYTSIEQYLVPLSAGLSISPLDQAALTKLNDSLIQAIQDLLNAINNQKVAQKADNQQLQAAMDQYKTYVLEQSASLVEETAAFVKAVLDGDIAKAKLLYGSSRIFYERIEPIAESFGDLDPKIDARENDVEPAEWTGFHVLEKALWVDGSLRNQEKYANQLLEDVKALHEQIKSVELKPAQVIAGAVELLNEAGTSKVTGEEERYSHLDLLDLAANVEGSKAAYDIIKASVQQQDAELVKKIDERFNQLQQLLDSFRQGDSFKVYTDLTQENTKSIGQAIESTAEALSQAAKIL
ncbi:iron uptake system protein EfeO [Ferviditalea candida]|uniref:Iron uptake system protein EfeO n=1 Tax=Ferviditalea candida TaxID=3108399 RepID=A0ABU5ZJ86_9BACL|nr:iron uptake system protein EfeO [Paenibacillaceae bacterium T2]